MAELMTEDFLNENYSPNPGEIVDLEDEEFIRHDTQILNLEDGPDAASIMPSTQGGGIYFTPDSGNAEEEEEKEVNNHNSCYMLYLIVRACV